MEFPCQSASSPSHGRAKAQQQLAEARHRSSSFPLLLSFLCCSSLNFPHRGCLSAGRRCTRRGQATGAPALLRLARRPPLLPLPLSPVATRRRASSATRKCSSAATVSPEHRCLGSASSPPDPASPTPSRHLMTSLHRAEWLLAQPQRLRLPLLTISWAASSLQGPAKAQPASSASSRALARVRVSLRL